MEIKIVDRPIQDVRYAMEVDNEMKEEDIDEAKQELLIGKVKKKLIDRGFNKEKVLNNLGLIGAAIEESIDALNKKV